MIRRGNHEEKSFRNLMFITGGILLVAVIAFTITYAVYSNKVKEEARVSILNSDKLADLVPSLQTDESKQASTGIGKTVNEMQNTISKNTVQNTVNNTANTAVNNTSTNTTEKTEVKQEPPKAATKKEISFKMPVEGEIVKEFAKDKLVYSETLKEWITHNGIDIKAEKTTVVKAAEDGTIKSIKNDPRYGLTVVMEHEQEYKTIYSNLLTAEFVSEGETIKQGQTIGTVGTTATFEIADEPHLHFEILKAGEYVDPNITITR